jgi:hypothetical protein
MPRYSQLCQPRQKVARFIIRCMPVKNNANRAKKWRGFRKIWRSLKPKLASKVLAHGAQIR